MIRQANFNTIREAFTMFYQICFGMVPTDLNTDMSLEDAQFVAERSNTRDFELWLDNHHIGDKEDPEPEPIDVGFTGEDLLLSWETETGIKVVATLKPTAPHVVVLNGHCLDINRRLQGRAEFKLVGSDRTQEAEELEQFISDLYAKEKHYGILNSRSDGGPNQWRAIEHDDSNNPGWIITLRTPNGLSVPGVLRIPVTTTEEAKAKLQTQIDNQADAIRSEEGFSWRKLDF